MIQKEIFDELSKTTIYSTKIFKEQNYRVTTGLLTIPFKLRPALDTVNFKMTTDVTIGPYFGITKRISKRNDYFITVPATLGLSFINLTNNTTSREFNDNEIDVVPGFTWSTGIITTWNKFTIGYVVGQDYASSVGDNWLYQGKYWHSFAIGYSFLKPDND